MFDHIPNNSEFNLTNLVAECIDQSEISTGSEMEFTVVADLNRTDNFNRGPRPDFQTESHIQRPTSAAQGYSDHLLEKCFDYESYQSYYNRTITELEESTTEMWKNPEKIAKWFFHLSYLYLSFVCLIVSLVTGLIVSIVTGGMKEEYRKSHPVIMFNTFFPKSYYTPDYSQSQFQLDEYD